MAVSVFILAYDFPPLHNTASQRPYAWAKYMEKYGFYPIIITKNRSPKIESDIIKEVHDSYTVYYVDCAPILQARYWNVKSRVDIVKRKFASFLNLFFHSSFLFGPYKKFYLVTRDLIKRQEGQKILIATAMPFGMFHVANRLHLESGITWVADYRDDWTTTELPHSSFLYNIVNRTLNRYLERKWVSTTSLITSVSPYYVDKITALFDGEIKGLVVQNGYFNEEIEKLQIEQKTKDISFVYVGSLYSSQNIKPVLIAIAKASLKVRVKFIFLGTPLARQIKKEFTDIAHDAHLEIIFYDRLPKQDALKIQQKCHYAVIVPHTGLKGIPSSKLYEFIGSKMPVLYYPNDHDIIDQIMNETGLGVSAVESAELDQIVEQLVSGNFVFSCNHEACNGFTRENSTSLFCDELKKVIR